jgi:hypothetical protein
VVRLVLGDQGQKERMMSRTRPLPADVVRQSATLTRLLPGTAWLHRVPEEARRFEDIAADGEARYQPQAASSPRRTISPSP